MSKDHRSMKGIPMPITSIDQSLAQQIVSTVKDVCGQDINFINPNGIITASTNEKRIGTYHEIGQKAASTGEIIEVDDDYGFVGTRKGINLPIYYNHNLISVVGISGEPAVVRKYAYLAERITRLLIRERELNAHNRNRDEKKQFTIHALLSNESVNQVYLTDCLKEFHVNLITKKRVILIRTNHIHNPADMPLMDQKVEYLFHTMSEELFTFNYPNEYLAIVDSDGFDRTNFMLKKFASDYGTLLKVAIGKESSLYRLAASFQSAQIAWKSIADSTESFTIFDNMILEIILSAISDAAKEEFLKKTISGLEKEELSLLRIYLEEDMSLLAASERLFLHKNTVQYKLNRIFDKTGFNPRRFQDAVLFYLALKLSTTDVDTSDNTPDDISQYYQ